MSQHRLCLAALTHVLAVVSMAPEAMARQPPSAMYACTTEASKKLPFCNADLSMDARVDDLVGRLTMDEKVSLLGAHGKDMCSFLDGGVPRLDIPSCMYVTVSSQPRNGAMPRDAAHDMVCVTMLANVVVGA